MMTREKLFSHMLIAVAITVTQAAAQSPGPGPEANPDPLKQIADTTGKASDIASLIKSGAKNIATAGGKIPGTPGAIGMIGDANKAISVGSKVLDKYNKDGAAAATGTLAKEGIAKVAGDYMNTTVSAIVTAGTVEFLGPLAPAAGTAAGFVAKKVTQAFVKETLDTVGTAMKTGKMPDPGQTLADTQYKNTGGDRGWKQGDTYVAPDGTQHQIGPLIIGADGTVKQTEGAVYMDGAGNIVRPPPKSAENSIDAPTPPSVNQMPQRDLVYGSDGQVHSTMSRTPDGTPLPPGSYVDGATGMIMTQNPRTGDWRASSEADYRNKLGMPVDANNTQPPAAQNPYKANSDPRVNEPAGGVKLTGSDYVPVSKLGETPGINVTLPTSSAGASPGTSSGGNQGPTTMTGPGQPPGFVAPGNMSPWPVLPPYVLPPKTSTSKTSTSKTSKTKSSGGSHTITLTPVKE